MNEPMLVETYSVWEQGRLGLRCLFVLVLLAGMAILVQMRGSILPAGDVTSTPPQAPRLHLVSAIEAEQQAEAQRADREQAAAQLAEARKILEAQTPPPAPTDPRLRAVLAKVPESQKKAVGDELAAQHDRLTKAYEKQLEQQRQAQLTEQQRREEDARRQAAARQQEAEEDRAQRLLRERQEALAKARQERELERKRAEALRRQQAELARQQQEKAAAEATAAATAAADVATVRDSEITGPVPGAYITIYPAQRFLGLTLQREYVRQYHRIAVPQAGVGKRSADDRKGPAGSYYLVARQKPDGTKGLQVSYPSPEDARRAVAEGRLDGAELERIEEAWNARALPPQDTALGGGIWITGDADARETTDGGFALEPAQFDELWTAVSEGLVWVIVKP